MSKTLFISELLLCSIGCSQLEIPCEINELNIHKQIISNINLGKIAKQNVQEYNGYDIEECVPGIAWYKNHYYKLLFHKEGKHYVTEHAYSCDNLKRDPSYTILDQKLIYIHVLTKLQYLRLRSIVLDYFVKLDTWFPLLMGEYTSIISLDSEKQLLKKDQYEIWIKEHPETQILNY